MWMLQEQVDLGESKGVWLNNKEQLTYQLFANDTDIFLNTIERNFKKATEIIKRYEAILALL